MNEPEPHLGLALSYHFRTVSSVEDTSIAQDVFSWFFKDNLTELLLLGATIIADAKTIISTKSTNVYQYEREAAIMSIDVSLYKNWQFIFPASQRSRWTHQGHEDEKYHLAEKDSRSLWVMFYPCYHFWTVRIRTSGRFICIASRQSALKLSD